MNILISGCAGFIDYSFALKILKTNKKIKVIGLDNLNNFYESVDKTINWYKKYKNLI